jgi:hypothetical protein
MEISVEGAGVSWMAEAGCGFRLERCSVATRSTSYINGINGASAEALA